MINNCIKSCIANANDFYEISCIIDSKKIMFQYKYLSVLATNLSFACELYLKSILMNEKQEIISGHKLLELYKQLKDDTKKELEMEFNKNKGMQNLMEVISNCNDTFVESRYLYENKKSIKIYITDLINLVNSLRIICKNKLNLDIK